jgi:DNA-binding transcriptional LysR family regulator
VTEAVLNRSALFGVSGPLEITSDLLVRGHAGAVKLIPVAHPDHPLAKMNKVTAALARDHIQLVLTDRSALTADRDLGVVAVKSWRLADLGAKHALLLAGLGWGSMPKPMVSDDLKRGRLVRLPIDTWDDVQYRFHTVHRSDTPLGPAASWLMERLAMDR